MFQAYVSSVSDGHCKSICFRGMLQVFQMDVTKVHWDDAYVAIVVYVCCKGLLPMFHLCFLDICCKCVYPDVAYVS
jgi:hypothetical protein